MAMAARLDIRPALLIALALLGTASWCAAIDSFISRDARAPEAMVYGPDDPHARQSLTPDAVQILTPSAPHTPTPGDADRRP